MRQRVGQTDHRKKRIAVILSMKIFYDYFIKKFLHNIPKRRKRLFCGTGFARPKGTKKA
jgi:hypothetical protein